MTFDLNPCTPVAAPATSAECCPRLDTLCGRTIANGATVEDGIKMLVQIDPNTLEFGSAKNIQDGHVDFGTVYETFGTDWGFADDASLCDCDTTGGIELVTPDLQVDIASNDTTTVDPGVTTTSTQTPVYSVVSNPLPFPIASVVANPNGTFTITTDPIDGASPYGFTYQATVEGVTSTGVISGQVSGAL